MDYYENNAKVFVESTLSVDMQSLYNCFLPLLPERANILDAGCGSGRDTKFFIERGHHFKYGQGEYEKQGRRFTDLDEAGLQTLVDEIEELTIRELWVTADLRLGRGHERWLNGILVSRQRPMTDPEEPSMQAAFSPR